MAKIDQKLKRILVWSILITFVLVCVVSGIGCMIYQRQMERELIYIKAREMAAEQQRERALNWQRRRREQQLKQEYQQGDVYTVTGELVRAAPSSEE